MKRFRLILTVCAAVVLVGAALALSAATAPQPARFVTSPTVQLAAAPAVAEDPAPPSPLPPAPAVVPSSSAKPRALNFIERRRYRLTVRELLPLVEEVLEEGEVDPDDSTAMAAAVLAKHIQDTPALQNDPSLDWDSLLEFIERILPLILQIIALFS